MGLLFASSFETANFTDWTAKNGSPTRASNQVLDGTFSMEVNAANEYVRSTAVAVANGTPLYQRIYLRLSGTPTGAHYCLAASNSAGTVVVAAVRVETDRTLTLRNSANAQIGSASAALTAGVWYRVELLTKLAASPTTSNGTAELQLDGVSVASTTVGNLGTAAAGRGYAGESSGTAPGITDYIDAYAARDDTWPGALSAAAAQSMAMLV
jgi:hypothetical protein